MKKFGGCNDCAKKKRCHDYKPGFWCGEYIEEPEMALQLNKKEHEYLSLLVQEDLDTDETYYNELISVEDREKLLKKIKDMKV